MNPPSTGLYLGFFKWDGALQNQSGGALKKWGDTRKKPDFYKKNGEAVRGHKKSGEAVGAPKNSKWGGGTFQKYSKSGGGQ